MQKKLLNKRRVNKLDKIAQKVESYNFTGLSNKELQGKTEALKQRLANGETLDDILPEAFATCVEASARVLGMRHYHVQILAGIALHQGRIAEQRTGEGKTLTATLPVYLNALSGKGVHVVTVNDYLARRDAQLMGRVYAFLGLTTKCLTHDLAGKERQEAYKADITYGTNTEFGFDYLRDNMSRDINQIMQRELNFALVDEVDSILIDEARTPLIISGMSDESTDMYGYADRFAKGLKKDDYEIDEERKRVSLTEKGIKKCEECFEIENLADMENITLHHHIMQALKANYIMERDIDYMLYDGEIQIVDEFTGRIMQGRRYSEGLHQAIEAKEGVPIKPEDKTMASITIQNYFRMYQKLAGMTGTAKTEETEFTEIYNMDVIEIPTNKPVQRKDLNDIVYGTENGKYKAIVKKIGEVYKTRQPILVGTTSVEVSEHIASLLRKDGIKDFNVLNARNHEKEAMIVAEAGRLGAVTIATNMAGRGTDIMLGGNPEFEARKIMINQGYSDEEIAFAESSLETESKRLEEIREEYKTILREKKNKCDIEKDKVIRLGGLYILGTERHESRRIDNQLRGRAGRQGDIGMTQFCVSLEDNLIRRFGGDRIKNFTEKMGIAEDDAIDSKMVARQIENAQKRVEGTNFGTRKYVLQYDNVMNKQREVIYKERRQVLEGKDLKEDFEEMLRILIKEACAPVCVASKYAEQWDFDRINKGIKVFCPQFEPLEFDEETLAEIDEESLENGIFEELMEMYDAKEKEIGYKLLRKVERDLLLEIIDKKWQMHIDTMEQLKEGLGLRGIGGQDPAAAYAHEGLALFEELNLSIQEIFIRSCFNIKVVWH